jgi:hypothetical protein
MYGNVYNTKSRIVFIENNDFHFIWMTKHNLIGFLFLFKQTVYREGNHDIQTLTLR